jgi:3-oxoacyl-ACP reductase-like protein
MGGLPEETEESHAATMEWLAENADVVWLCNLYNFVPYPLTPDFPRLRERIFEWNFAAWREDAPPVFFPYHLTPERSWTLFKEKVRAVHELVARDAEQQTVGAR